MDAYLGCHQDNSRYFIHFGNWLPWQLDSTVGF